MTNHSLYRNVLRHFMDQASSKADSKAIEPAGFLFTPMGGHHLDLNSSPPEKWPGLIKDMASRLDKAEAVGVIAETSKLSVPGRKKGRPALLAALLVNSEDPVFWLAELDSEITPRGRPVFKQSNLADHQAFKLLIGLKASC
jgi:hypothetical protein